MIKKSLSGGVVILIVIGMSFFPGTSSFAQFNVYSWNNFETGNFPSNLERLHDANEENSILYDLTSGDAPAGILDGIAKTECGRYCMKYRITKLKEYIKVVSKTTLDRKNMGDKGKALYQADMFIPEDLSELPYSLGVMAVLQEADGSSAKFSFYRFGIRGDAVYFSYTYNEAQPRIYLHTRIDALNLKRPGWHRFQIIFEGQENITCAVDGQPTSFSPIQEGTLDKLRAGLMITASTTETGMAYIDNLSIQWTTEDVPLPDSPWVHDVRQDSAPSPLTPFAQDNSSVPVKWFTSPEEAWQQCLSQNRPTLILFFAPRATAWKNLEKLIQSNQTVSGIINQFIPLQIDANQLRGGTLAYQFGAFRVPCFIVLGPDQKVRLKEFYKNESDWNLISEKLQNSLSQ
ncbi:hypothetical protein JW926_16415 [Candidatus Sumerlaeota bacterium]|nr:hypothetical protein [Candidatus Sumerlaeota bacterium]